MLKRHFCITGPSPLVLQVHLNVSGQTRAQTWGSESFHPCCTGSVPPQSSPSCLQRPTEPTSPAPPSETKRCLANGSLWPNRAPRLAHRGGLVSTSLPASGASARTRAGTAGAARGSSSMMPPLQPVRCLFLPLPPPFRAPLPPPVQSHLSPQRRPPNPKPLHPAGRGKMWWKYVK